MAKESSAVQEMRLSLIFFGGNNVLGEISGKIGKIK